MPACISRSLFAICSSSSGVMKMAIPFCHLLPQLFRRDFAGDLAVVHHRWSQPARAQTTGRKDGYSSIGSGLARSNAQFALHNIQQLARPLDIARRTQADHASVLARGLESKKMIKRGHPIGSAERHSQRDGDIAQRGFIQIAEGFLNGVKSLDESAGALTDAAPGRVKD